jgi:hypothetical protein
MKAAVTISQDYRFVQTPWESIQITIELPNDDSINMGNVEAIVSRIPEIDKELKYGRYISNIKILK